MRKAILFLFAAATMGVQAGTINVDNANYSVQHSLSTSNNPQTLIMHNGTGFRVGAVPGHQKAQTAYTEFRQSLETCKAKFVEWENACKQQGLDHARQTLKLKGWYEIYRNGHFVPSSNSSAGLVGVFEMTPQGAKLELSTKDVVRHNHITKHSVKVADAAKITFSSAAEIQALIDQMDYNMVKAQLEGKKASKAVLN